MSSTKTAACLTCRYRKVKCDGVLPECGSCIRGMNLECVYGDGKRALRPNVLRRGKACNPCRRKKTKCGAELPVCRTCEAAGNENACHYNSPTKKAAFIPTEHSKLPIILIKPVSWSPKTLHTVITVQSPDQPQLLVVRIEPDPPIKLSDSLSPNHSDKWACSDVSPADTNMSLRLAFLSHRYQIGIYLPASKQQAILLGDVSGIFVHPFFVDYANASGARMYYEKSPSFRYMFMIGIYMQLAWQSLVIMPENAEPCVQAQGYYCMFVGFLRIGRMAPAKRYLRKAITTVHEHRIRFVEKGSDGLPLSSFPLQYSEEAHERIALLAKLVYAEALLQITTGEVWCSTFEYELQFRSELPVAHPILFHICPIILSVRSILFVKDAQALISSHEKHAVPDWTTRTKILINGLTNHITGMVSSSSEPLLKSDPEGLVSMHSSIIICLATKAKLCHLLTKNSESYSYSPINWANECERSLGDVVNMTSQLTGEDLNLVDPFLSPSWDSVIEILNERHPLIDPFANQFGTVPVEDDIFILTDARVRLETIISPPTLLCEQLADINYRLQPGIPNYLLEPVRIEAGI